MTEAILNRWAEVEPLLDQLLELPPQARAAFLDQLPPEQQALRAPLERLLAQEAEADAAGFLDHAASHPFGTTASAEAAPTHWREGQELGPWHLIRELGRGGMASVWLARQAHGEFQREVALKLPHGAGSHLADRFRRERDVLARLNHPGIARLYDAGVTLEGLPWLAMEFVEGEDLLAWCQRRAAPLAERLGLLLQIADALQYAHGRLVIHRDIKPANVLVQPDGQVRLLDFGIARLLDGPDQELALTQAGQRPMTPEYASPEQVRGEEPGIASDVYSLGVLAYRLLSQSSPYQGAQAAHRHALEQSILTFQPAPLSQVVDDPAWRRALQGDLDGIVLKALNKEPAQRYATVEAFAADIRRHLAGVPVLARGPSWRYFAGRFVRRHRVAVAGTAVAVIGLVSLTAWALHAADQARQEAQRSQAMYDFVVGLFNPRQSPQPDTRDRDMPVSRLIERGAEQVLGHLKDQPQVRERLLADLGTLTQQLGMAPMSQRLGQERVDTAREQYGPTSVAYADALFGQRDSWEATGQYAKGYEKAREGLAIYEDRGVKDPLRLARAHMAVGGFGARLHPADDTDLGHLRRAAELLEPLPGPTFLGTVYEQLMVAYLGRGQMEESFQTALLGVKANQRLWGAEDWKTAASEDQAGALAALTLRPLEAERLMRHGLAGSRKAMGPDVVLLARGEANLASLLFAGEQREDARAHLREAQRIVNLPGNRAQLAFSLTVDATALEIAQREGDWATLRQGCARWGDAVQTPQPALSLRFAQSCIASAVHDGRLAQAQALLTQATDLAAKAFAKMPARHAVLDLRAGELAQAQGNPATALAAWRDCLRHGDATTPAWTAQAWAHLLDSGTMTPAEQASLQAFRRQLTEAGGWRAYAEFLTLSGATRS